MKIYLILLMLLPVFFIGGCTESASVAGGALGMKIIAEEAQNRLVDAINVLNEETIRINNTIDEIEGTVLIKPETLKAVEGVKEREKDPVTWIALVSLLSNAFLSGRGIKKVKK